MRLWLAIVLAACGSSATAVHPATPAAGSAAATGGTTYAVATARVVAAIADTTCACTSAACAGASGTSLMVFSRDMNDLVNKTPVEDYRFPDGETALLGDLDVMEGIDGCWAKRAEWEAERAGACYSKLADKSAEGRTRSTAGGGAKVTDKAATAVSPAPQCPAQPELAKPAIEAWWKAPSPCPAGTKLDEKRTDSLSTMQCWHSGGHAVGRNTAWWAYNKMPAHDGSYDANGVEHGAWTYWFHDGNRAVTGTYDHGAFVGTWTRWYPNGKKRDVRVYDGRGDQSGEPPGTRTEWWPNGNKRFEATFVGQRVRTFWYANGIKAAEVGFDDSAHNGPFTYWWSNGQVKLKGTWVAAQEDGTWEHFDDTGKLLRIEQWQRGKLASTPPIPMGTPPFTAASLFDEAAVRAINGYTGGLERKTMEPSASNYDDLHFRAVGNPETYDVAVRVWILDTKAAVAKYDEMKSSLPNVKDLAKLGDRALTAEESEIFGIGFYDPRGVVVLLTCGKQQCKTLPAAIKLAKQIHGKLPKRW
ncbi:MAG: hypothetical protein ABI867_13995 [Kofleriaceae bacterium]